LQTAEFRGGKEEFCQHQSGKQQQQQQQQQQMMTMMIPMMI
jgi:hypothetical protein